MQEAMPDEMGDMARFCRLWLLWQFLLSLLGMLLPILRIP